MKTFNFNRLFVASLMLSLFVGCGKDQKSGSAPAPAPAPAPVVQPVQQALSVPSGLPSQYHAAFTKLITWYGAADTVNIGKKGVFYKGAPITASASFNVSYCLNLGFKTYGDCDQAQPEIAYNKCYFLSGSTYAVGTPGADGMCNITESSVTKSTNANLKEALSRTDLQLLAVVEYYPGVFVLTYGAQFVPKAEYVVDTNLHSLLNPVSIIDTGKGLKEVLGGIKVLIQ